MSRLNEQDHYDVLGVEENANSDAITSAYYLRARQLHPDTSCDTDPSSRRFKALTRAYEVLIDPTLRRAYDKRRREHHRPPPPAPWSEQKHGWVEATDILSELPITPEEAFHGGPCELQVTRRCGCLGRRHCSECKGSGYETVRETVVIQVPAGTRTGAICVVPGRGHIDAEGSRGTLYLRLIVRPCW